MSRIFSNVVFLVVIGILVVIATGISIMSVEMKANAQSEKTNLDSSSKSSKNEQTSSTANDGDLDTTFNIGGSGVGGRTQNHIEALAIQNDGKILIGGSFKTYNGVNQSPLTRLNVDGSRDTTFNASSVIVVVRDIAIQSDGKILIAGFTTSFTHILRLNADGSFDATFNSVQVDGNGIYDIAIQADGKILIGGQFTDYYGISRNNIARLNANGTLDTTFNPGSGTNGNGDVNNIAIQADGKIIIGGYFSIYNGISRNSIARLNADGSLDTSFNSNFGDYASVHDIAIQGDGKTLIGGSFSTYNGVSRNNIARLNANGTLDTTFNPGSGANMEVYDIKIQGDGKILIGGYFTIYNGVSRNRIARLNADGNLDTTFNPGSGTNDGVEDTLIQSDGKILIGGYFTTYDGVSTNGIARLLNSCCSAINITPSIVAVNQTTNLIVNGSNFQNNFTASVTTPAGTIPIAAAGLTFVNSNQVRVRVNMTGTPPYTATLRINNPNNQSTAGQFQVVSTTNPPPFIGSISPSQIPTNQQRTLTVNGSNFKPGFRVSVQGAEIATAGLTYISNTEVQVQVTMGSVPPYQASLTLTNPDGQTASGNFSVNNNPPNPNSPNASFTFAPTNPNVNQSIQFTSTSTGQSLSYAWDFQGDGIIDSTAANPTFTFTTPGTRSVILRVTNSYGSSTVTNVVNVGTTNTTVPYVIEVIRTYPGLYFLQNANFNNTFDARVNWNGSPGKVIFQVNNNAPVEVPGTTNGASRTFNLSTAFPANGRSVIKITPVNAQGTVGVTNEKYIYVFPYPTWLNDAINRIGSKSLNFTAESGQIKANFNVDFPQPPFKAEIPIPQSVPYIGGTLGIRDTSAFFKGFASSSGTGSLSLGGKTGFKAMNQEIGGNISGSGKFTLNQSGLALQSATFNLGLDGTISREIGVIDAIPQLTALNTIPAVKQFNEQVKLKGYIKPTINFSANWIQDNSTQRLRFNNTTGQVGLKLGGELNAKITDHFKAKGWVSGGGTISFRVPEEPLVQRLDLTFESGVQINVDYLLAGLQFKRTSGVNCTWTPADNEANCSRQNSGTNVLTENLTAEDSKVDLIENNYNKFGGYEIFHPKAEKTNQIERKESSSETSLAMTTESSLVNNIFPGAEPVILEVGTGRMLVWVRQNPSLPVLQSTEIAWSYYDGTSWSNPAVFASDTRAELSPVAGVDASGKVVLAWLRIKDPSFSTNIENVADFPLFYKQMEVVSAVFNPATRTWSSETALTDDLALDTNLRLSASSSGNLLLTWQSNPNGEFNADAANPATLKYSFWNGSSWNTVGVVANNLVNVSAQAAAVKGNNAFIILPRDPDLSVLNDRALDVYTWNGSAWSQAAPFAGGNLDNILPSAIYDSTGKGQVIWLRGADLVQADLNNPTPRVIRQGSESMAFYNARLLSNSQNNLTLVWQEMVDNGPANIFAMLYDTASQTWSSDIRLNENDWSAKDVSGYYGSDGKLRIAYLATEVLRRVETITIEGQDYQVPNVPEDGQTDLRLLEHSLITDLSVGDKDLQLEPQIPGAGESVTATLNVHNSGDFPIGNFNVKLYAGDPSSNGVVIGSTRINTLIGAGETRTLTVTFIYPQTVSNIIAIIDADSEINEFSETNNRAAVFFVNNPPAAIATASLTSGNSPLTVNFDASSSYDNDGDALSFAWAFADGSQSATGASVSHTFVETGLYPATVSVTDARGAVSTASINISVNCNAITIMPPVLPDGSTLSAYSQNFSATGGNAPYLFAIANGRLPAGLTFSGEGLLSGIPTESGIFNFTTTTTYANGCPGNSGYTLTIDETRIEGDVSPRNSGNGFVSSTDVSQLTRFQLGLDKDYMSNEFQRADCAPSSTRGNGVVSSTDVSQATRYQLGLDSPQTAGGPTAPTPSGTNRANVLDSAIGSKANSAKLSKAVLLPRVVRVVNTNATAGSTVSVTLQVDAVGDESVYGFSLNYDTTKLTLQSITNGAATSGAVVGTNTNNPGEIGFSVNYGNATIQAGNNQTFFTIQFKVAANAPSGATTVFFDDTPTVREVSNTSAQPVPTTFADSTVTISGTTAAVAVSGRVMTATGRGIRNVQITLTDSEGNIRTAKTTAFGYYRFADIAAGQTYIINAKTKRFTFSQPILVVNAGQDLTEINFTALP